MSTELARKQNTIKKRLYVLDYLTTHPYIDYHESDPVVLEFDHVRGIKTCPVSTMMVSWCSLTRLKNEIAKCEIRCANCHRRKHAKDQKWYKETGAMGASERA